MNVFAWIVSALGAALLVVLFVAVMLIAAVLLPTLSVEGRLARSGGAVRLGSGLIRAEIDGASRLMTVRLAGLRLVRTKVRRPPAKPATASAHTTGKEAKSGKKPRSHRSPDLLLSSYRRLARVALHELRAMARHLHVTRLRVDLTLASDDPAWTGEAYGLGCAVLAWLRSVWPDADRSRADVRLSTDFTTTRPSGSADVAVSVRPVRLLPGTLRIAFHYWTERRRSRRRASGARASVASRT